jgi:hypothetical protein
MRYAPVKAAPPRPNRENRPDLLERSRELLGIDDTLGRKLDREVAGLVNSVG